MANTSPGPCNCSAAWHALIKDRSIQFDFPSSPALGQPPGWLVNLIKFIGDHLVAFRTGGWVLLGGLVLAALYIIVRLIVRRGWTRREKNADRTVANAWQPSPERARLLLADADALAAQNRFDEAAHLLLLVAVQEIGERRPGLVRPALTAREIAALPALSDKAREVFGAIARIVERCIFGGRSLGAGDYASIRAQFEQFTIPDVWRQAA